MNDELAGLLTADKARSLLDYDPDTGLLRWKRPRGSSRPGWTAGTEGPRGYKTIGVCRKRYLVHRMAWLMMTGQWPRDQVDHINGCRSDNRWVNLREATNGQNQQNAILRRTNKSGFRGVDWYKRDNRWRAQITHKGVSKTLGYFDRPEDAHAAYLAARAKLSNFQPRPREECQRVAPLPVGGETK